MHVCIYLHMHACDIFKQVTCVTDNKKHYICETTRGINADKKGMLERNIFNAFCFGELHNCSCDSSFIVAGSAHPYRQKATWKPIWNLVVVLYVQYCMRYGYESDTKILDYIWKCLKSDVKISHLCVHTALKKH